MAERIAEKSSHNIVGWFKLSNPAPVVGDESGRRGHTLALANNMVIMSMGECRNRDAATQLFCLDLRTWEWTKLASTEPARAHHTFYISKGKLWSFFGTGASSVSALDLQDHTYKQITSDNDPANRFGHGGGIVNGRDVVVFGGTPSWSRNTTVTADLHVFDIETTKWKRPNISSRCPKARYFHTMTSMKHPDRLLLFGGRKKEKEVFGDLWVLDTKEWIWITCNVTGEDKPLGRAGHSLTQVSDYRWILYGGWDGSVDPDSGEEVGALNDTWILYQNGETSFSWRELTLLYKPMPTDCHRAVYLHHLDAVLIHGGADPGFNIINDTHVIMGEGLWSVPSLSTLAVDCLISHMTDTTRSTEDQQRFLKTLSKKLPTHSLAIISERLSFLKAMGHLKTADEKRAEEEAKEEMVEDEEIEPPNEVLARVFDFLQQALQNGLQEDDFEALQAQYNLALQHEEEQEQEDEELDEPIDDFGFVNEHPVEARNLSILAGDAQVGALVQALDFVKQILKG